MAVDRECNVYIADIANNRLRCIGRDGTIRPFAGCGRFGYSGDGGDALDAEFQEIYGIGMSAAGDKLYLADYGNHRIRKIDLFSRRIDTIAGCGRPGYSGDGGDAREACLQNPVAVCGDSRGNVFIADAGNQAVRILPAGDKRIFTVAGGVGIGTGRSGEGRTGFRSGKPQRRPYIKTRCISWMGQTIGYAASRWTNTLFDVIRRLFMSRNIEEKGKRNHRFPYEGSK